MLKFLLELELEIRKVTDSKKKKKLSGFRKSFWDAILPFIHLLTIGIKKEKRQHNFFFLGSSEESKYV